MADIYFEQKIKLKIERRRIVVFETLKEVHGGEVI
jgi:hypothetical protein